MKNKEVFKIKIKPLADNGEWLNATVIPQPFGYGLKPIYFTVTTANNSGVITAKQLDNFLKTHQYIKI